MPKLAQSTILVGDDIDQLIDLAKTMSREVDGQHILMKHQDKNDKIKEVRELYRFSRGIQKKPLVFILNADSFFATVTNDPWQNAFLKLFEEPGHNIYFILATTMPQKLLPTIRSRGQIIKHSSPSAKKLEGSNWFTISVYERLKMVAKIKTREEGLKLAKSVATEATGRPEHAKSLPLISDTLDRLTQNGNVKLQLTNLAVNL